MANGIDWEHRIGRRIRLRDLHVLSAVAQSGSMSKAAARLGVSQPVVSQAVADLEAAVGQRLLDRSSRGVAPTLYGEALLKHGQMAFDDLRQAVREIDALADPAAGEVWVGCPESLSGALLPPVIEQLAKEHPRAVFHVAQVNTLSTQLEFPELRQRKLDVVMARLVRPFGEFEFEEDLTVEHLFDDELLVVSATTSPWARRRKIDLAELADAPWILPPNSWNRLIVEEGLRARGCQMSPTSVETFSVAIRNRLLASGCFVAAIPGSMYHLNVTHGVKVLPVDLPRRPWPVVMVTLKNRTTPPLVNLFIRRVRDLAHTIPAPVLRRSSRRQA
jgi:DNA-binding transcriptional LysR family regulator